MVDIRLKTQIVVEKNGKYLIGLYGIPRWSGSPYDAWQTRNTANAIYVAWKMNGDLALFNPIVAESRKLDWMQREDIVRRGGRRGPEPDKKRAERPGIAPKATEERRAARCQKQLTDRVQRQCSQHITRKDERKGNGISGLSEKQNGDCAGKRIRR